MANFVEQIKTIWGDMSGSRRIVMMGSLVAIVAALSWVIASQSVTNWKTLGRGLTNEDLHAAKAALDEKNIPVRLTQAGTLEVPGEHLDQARIEIATSNAASGNVGMELFNESTFGQSSFQENINYHRALQGELARTIQSIDGVKSARVHLVIPKKRLFKKDQKAPTASVKLTLKPGIDLSKQQVAGIRFLVSNAIEGMQSNAVTIIDHRGNTLARPDDSMMAGGETFHELQTSYESKLEERIVDLLTPVLGEGKVRAQVSATLDFSAVEVTEKTLDPENQVVLKEDRHVENASTQEKDPSGVPGVASNVPGRPAANTANDAKTTNKTMRKEALSYDTNSSLRKTILPLGRLKRLSVAVAVDGKLETGEDGTEQWAPRGADEMAQIEDLVSKAAGIDLDRGDQLAVVNTQFNEVLPEVDDVTPAEAPFWLSMIPWAILLLIAGMVLFGVIRPMIRQHGQRIQAQMVRKESPNLLSAPGADSADADGTSLSASSQASASSSNAIRKSDTSVPATAIAISPGEKLRQVATSHAERDVPRAAQIIRTWLLVEE